MADRRLDLVLVDYKNGDVYTVTPEIQGTEDPDSLFTYVTIGGDVMDMVHVLTQSDRVE